MEITYESLQERIKLAEKEREIQIGNINKLNGVIEDCEYWLGQLTVIEVEDKEESKVKKLNKV